MKTKFKITIVIMVAITLSIGVGIMAFNRQPNVMERMKKFRQLEVIEEISEDSIQGITVASSENITNREHVKEYMIKNQLIEKDESDYKIQMITNNVTSEKYYRITGTGATIDIIQDTGELRRYVNSKPTDYRAVTIYDKEKTENVAKKIMRTNELLQANRNYELVEIKEKTDYYPTACFKDGINNKLMYMIFDPNSEEIMVIATQAIPVSENNEIKINEITAKNIAKDQANMAEEDILKVEQKEVIPNSMFLEAGYYYSDMNIKRNAYVITFDTISKLQIFVDATTGEVIGGDGIW